MFRRPAFLFCLALLFSGCGHAGLSGVAGPPAGFPFPLRDGHTGAALTEASLITRIAAAQAVYVGEKHDDAASHDVQLAVLLLSYRLDPDVALGLEMLPRSMQGQLDAYLAGKLDEEAFLKAVDWEHTWGFAFAMYRPLFSFCKVHRLHIYALNNRIELVRAVRKDGIDNLPAQQRADLPDGYPWPQPLPHRAYLHEIFEKHMRPPPAEKSDKAAEGTAKAAEGAAKAPDKPDPKADAEADAEAEEAFARFYLAQLVWDESMAQAVAEILHRPGAPKRLVVLAGTGHVGRFAIPFRARRRGVESALTLDATGERTGPPPEGVHAVDLLVVTAPDKGAAAP
jgi:uncharacterized iron-regulated protein